MSQFSQIKLGWQTFWEGLSFLRRHKSLWLWAALPFTLSVLILFVGFGLGFHYFDTLIAKIPYYLWLDQVWAGTIEPASLLLKIILVPLFLILKYLIVIPIVFLLGMVLMTLLCFFVYLVLAAPFSDLLAEKTTYLFRGEEPPAFTLGRLIKGIVQTVIVELRKVFLMILFPLLFFVLHFVPIVGSILYLILISIFGMWVLGLAMVDYPMSHQMLSYKERLDFARQHKFSLIGFGFPFLIPLVPLLLQTPMVVGGTILFHKLKRENKTAE